MPTGSSSGHGPCGSDDVDVAIVSRRLGGMDAADVVVTPLKGYVLRCGRQRQQCQQPWSLTQQMRNSSSAI